MSSTALNDRSTPTLASLLECLPEAGRTAKLTITPVAAGNSGAGVFLVETDGGKTVLKITATTESVGDWRRAVATQRFAAAAGVAPHVLHTDETRRAVLSSHVADHSFPAFFGNPATRENALRALGRMVRNIHAIAPLPEHPVADPVAMLSTFWAVLHPDASAARIVPLYAYESWQRIVHERAPEMDRAPVLSHNDMNPSNLVYDGERLLMFDWQTTAINDPYYDLATIATFLRMDEAASLQLLSAYDDAMVTKIPARFIWFRRMAAVVSGSAFLYVARLRGYDEMDATLTLDAAPALSDIYAALRSGTLNLGLPAAQWQFGLALLKASATA